MYIYNIYIYCAVVGLIPYICGGQELLEGAVDDMGSWEEGKRASESMELWLSDHGGGELFRGKSVSRCQDL